MSPYCLTTISRLRSSCEMVLGKNWKFFNFTQRLLRLSRDCFTTKSFSRNLQCVSQLPNPQKMHVFSFYVADVTVFSNTLFFPRTASLKPLSTQNLFSLKPHHFQAKISIKSPQDIFS